MTVIKKMNLFLLIGIICIFFKTFPELLKVFSSNYPFGVIGEVFIDNEENLYVVNSSYNRIHKYNKDGEFLFSWNISCRFSEITVRYENNTFHIFCIANGLYYKYDNTGSLISLKTKGKASVHFPILSHTVINESISDR